MQGIAFQSGSEVRFVDAFLRFAPGQDLHDSFTAVMGGVHDSDRIGRQEHKNTVQHMHHKVHRCDIIVVDDDPVQRFVGRFLLLVFADFDVWNWLHFHVILAQSVELLDFLCG